MCAGASGTRNSTMVAKIIEHARYIALIGVIALLITSLAAFGWGALKAMKAIQLILTSGGEAADIPLALIEVVDGFLIATALFVFAVSLHQLFIGASNLPEWMCARNLAELKTKLSSVIVLVIVVKFMEHLLEWSDPAGTLQYAVAVAVVSATLIALAYFGKKD